MVSLGTLTKSDDTNVTLALSPAYVISNAMQPGMITTPFLAAMTGKDTDGGFTAAPRRARRLARPA